MVPGSEKTIKVLLTGLFLLAFNETNFAALAERKEQW
jgi:hypothetical protein